MAIISDNKNKILARISVAARTALGHPRNVELAHFIGTGPSIRARARLALAAAFVVAAPILFIGVMRTEDVAEHATKLSEYDDYWKRMLEVRIAVKEVSLSIWAYSVEPELENGQAVLDASEYLMIAIQQMVAEKPTDLSLGPKGFFEGLANRLDGLLKRSIANRSSLAQARLNIISLSRELTAVEKRVIDIAKNERQEALGSLATLGRDQLILFLVLIFAIPIFVGFIPGWLVSPLSRLRQLSSKIELGQLREMSIAGRDEVAMVARSLKSYYLRKEELDQKKSSKIFEMRNILRAVLNRVAEPIFIIDENTKINYTNGAAAQLVGLPPHQMEGKPLSDCIYAPTIKKSAEKAFEGDVSDSAMIADIEVPDGRSFAVRANIGVVRNRDGEASRAVIVMMAKTDAKVA